MKKVIGALSLLYLLAYLQLSVQDKTVAAPPIAQQQSKSTTIISQYEQPAMLLQQQAVLEKYEIAHKHDFNLSTPIEHTAKKHAADTPSAPAKTQITQAAQTRLSEIQKRALAKEVVQTWFAHQWLSGVSLNNIQSDENTASSNHRDRESTVLMTSRQLTTEEAEETADTEEENEPTLNKCIATPSKIDGVYQGCQSPVVFEIANIGAIYNMFLTSFELRDGGGVYYNALGPAFELSSFKELCLNSGTKSLGGQFNQAGINFAAFSACKDNDLRLNGVVLTTNKTWNSKVHEITHRYNALHITHASLGLDLVLHKDATVLADVVNDFEVYTYNDIIEDFTAQAEYKREHLTMHIQHSDLEFEASSGNQSVSFSGRVYISTLGYADIQTISPLFYSPANMSKPQSGELLIAGQNNSTLRIQILGIAEPQIAIYIDTDGDSVEDIFYQTSWDKF